MSNLILPNQAKLNWAQSQIDDSPTLSGATIRLYDSPLVITSATTLEALEAVQATFPGYAAKLLDEWSDAVMIAGLAGTEADPVVWEATEDTEGLVYGLYVVNGAGDRLLGVCPFESPVPIPFNVELQAVIQIDFDSIFST